MGNLFPIGPKSYIRSPGQPALGIIRITHCTLYHEAQIQSYISTTERSKYHALSR